jgi:uncharacterized membrane protein YkvA (DUF1232 family)
MNNRMPRSGAGGWGFSGLVRDLATAWRLLGDPRVPGLLKFALPVLALLYWLSPIDLMPGLPFDDIAVLWAALRLFLSLAPQASVDRAAGGANWSGAGRQADDGQVVDTTWRVVDE